MNNIQHVNKLVDAINFKLSSYMPDTYMCSVSRVGLTFTVKCWDAANTREQADIKVVTLDDHLQAIVWLSRLCIHSTTDTKEAKNDSVFKDLLAKPDFKYGEPAKYIVNNQIVYLKH